MGLGEHFRKLHHGDKAFVMPNPWDIGTARILASMGFEALATTSAGMAFMLGRPEGRTGKDEILAHCRMIVSATGLPVSADLEKGFGDGPQAVADTIRAARPPVLPAARSRTTLTGRTIRSSHLTMQSSVSRRL